MELLATSVKTIKKGKFDKPYCFELFTTGKAYVISAENEVDKTAWIELIKSVSDSLIRTSIGYGIKKTGKPFILLFMPILTS